MGVSNPITLALYLWLCAVLFIHSRDTQRNYIVIIGYHCITRFATAFLRQLTNNLLCLIRTRYLRRIADNVIVLKELKSIKGPPQLINTFSVTCTQHIYSHNALVLACCQQCHLMSPSQHNSTTVQTFVHLSCIQTVELVIV